MGPVQRLFLIIFAITILKCTNSIFGVRTRADGPQSDMANANLLSKSKTSNHIGDYTALGMIEGESEMAEDDFMEAILFRDFTQVDTMRYVRPGSHNSTGQTFINVYLSLLKINNIVDKDEMLTTTVQLKIIWEDVRLRWNTTKYGNLEFIHLPANMLWMPEIELMNGYRVTHIDLSRNKAKVFSNGTVSISRVMHLDTSCTLDVKFYPYDDQVCHITIGSWNWNAKELVFVNDGMSVEKFELSMTWALIGTWNKSLIVGPSDTDGGGFSFVVFTLYLERQSLFHSIHLIWPTVLLASLVCLIFLVPGDTSETIGLAVTLLLTFTVYLLYAADKMPENSRSVPLFGIILMCFHMLSATSILICVILLIWHFLGDHKKMPGWARIIVFDCIRPLICMALHQGPPMKKTRNEGGVNTQPTSHMTYGPYNEDRPDNERSALSGRPILSANKAKLRLPRIPAKEIEDINRNEIPADLDPPGRISVIEDDAVDDARTYKYAAKICGRFIGLLYFVLILGYYVIATIVIKNMPSPCWNNTECTLLPDNSVNYWETIRKQFSLKF